MFHHIKHILKRKRAAIGMTAEFQSAAGSRELEVEGTPCLGAGAQLAPSGPGPGPRSLTPGDRLGGLCSKAGEARLPVSVLRGDACPSAVPSRLGSATSQAVGGHGNYGSIGLGL